MFQVNGSFYTFLSALQERLKLDFSLKALTEEACLLYPEDEGIRIIYYRCGAAHRIPVAGDGRCIHIDEDLWTTRPDLLLNRIAAGMGQAQRIHARDTVVARIRSEEHTSELQSLMRISYAVFCLKKK